MGWKGKRKEKTFRSDSLDFVVVVVVQVVAACVCADGMNYKSGGGGLIKKSRTNCIGLVDGVGPRTRYAETGVLYCIAAAAAAVVPPPDTEMKLLWRLPLQ